MTEEICEGYTNYETSRLGLLLENTEEIKAQILEFVEMSSSASDFKGHIEDVYYIEEYDIYYIEDTSFDAVTWDSINFNELLEDFKEKLEELKNPVEEIYDSFINGNIEQMQEQINKYPDGISVLVDELKEYSTIYNIVRILKLFLEEEGY